MNEIKPKESLRDKAQRIMDAIDAAIGPPPEVIPVRVRDGK